MKRLFFPTMAALAAITVTAGSAQAVYMSFESDFTTWTGQDATSWSPVSSSTGHTPGSDWTVVYDGAGAAAPGWLTQGSIGGTPTTAKFWHYVPPGTGSARARFACDLPAAWVADGLEDTGMRVRYGMKYATGYHSDRGVIQISFPTTAHDFTSYIRVRHHPDQVNNPHTMIVPIRNGGGGYNVDTLYLEDEYGDPRYIGDEWHDWTAVYEYAYVDNDHWAYVDLYLDDEHLLFGGADGSPELGGRTYSFRLFDDEQRTYIGLGELQNCQHWDFECDYVDLDNVPEPATLVLLALGGLLMRRRRA